ncbi:hypothetical protein Slala02_59370 [Streptomyces lavendulae subsp. lavendulae]|nr:hypothetical protein Slala01_62780 [Streptomyces lavendulae subsp. lavendulae]GLX30117.1 hypothetical protein Slala02_59370 [Streptomyces lavendulae subsp. lavendulae]
MRGALAPPLTYRVQSGRFGREHDVWHLPVKGAGRKPVKGIPRKCCPRWRARAGEPAWEEGTQRGAEVTDGRKTAAIGVLRWCPS